MADAPAAGHAAHLDGGLLPVQDPGKGRVDLIAHGREVGQRDILVGQRRLPLLAGGLPGLCRPYPVHLADDIVIRRLRRYAQR